MWLFLSVASAALLGFYEVLRKAAVHGSSPLPTLCLATCGGLLFLSPLALLSSLAPELLTPYGLAVGGLTMRGHLLVLAKAVLVSSSWALSYRAVQNLPISIAGPLRATSPLFTVLGGLLLFGERPTLSQWCGMFLLALGYLSFASLGPKEGIHFFTNRWVGLLILGTALSSLSALYDKLLLQREQLAPTSLQFWFTFDSVFFQTALAARYWWPHRKKEPVKITVLAFAVGIALVVADQLYLRALADPEALVSVVSLTRRSSVLLSFLIGGLVFREQLLRKKAVPLVFVFAGLLLLILGPTGSSPRASP